MHNQHWLSLNDTSIIAIFVAARLSMHFAFDFNPRNNGMIVMVNHSRIDVSNVVQGIGYTDKRILLTAVMPEL